MKAFVFIAGFFCLATPVWPADNAAAGSASRVTEWQRFFPSTENSHWVYRFTNHQNDSHSKITIHAHKGQPVGDLKMTDPHVFEENSEGERSPIVYFQDEHGYLTQFLDAKYGVADALLLPPHANDGVQILPPHLAPGVEWTQRAVLIGWVRWKHRVVGAETVTVPAGVFADTYRIEATVVPEDDGDINTASNRFGMFDYRYTDWYAPDVGLVKSTTTGLTDGGLVVTQELESYTLVPVAPAAPGAPSTVAP